MSHVSPGRPGTTAGTLGLVALVLAIVVGGLWWLRQQDEEPTTSAEEPTTSAEELTTSAEELAGAGTGRGDGADADPELGERAEEIAAQEFPDEPRVVVISIDGLGSLWVSKQSTPNLATLLSQGAGTLNARTEVEKTVTLPNHTGMVTGRRADAAAGGHGVTWNSTSARTVALGTSSVFSVIDDADGTSGVFVGKSKFEMWGRAWPGAIDALVIKQRQRALVGAAIRDLRRDDHDLVFLHLGGPDAAGHALGWGSAAYLDAVADADADLARVVSAISADPDLADEVVLVVTADHGGVPGTTMHIDATRPENYTIPFLVWGPGIRRGDLYALNPDYTDPGTTQPAYDDAPPVRNGVVANLVTDLLGLDAVPGSEFDADHGLDVAVE